ASVSVSNLYLLECLWVCFAIAGVVCEHWVPETWSCF
ncbi:unnamed protein product, partial [Brassica oleracea]